MTTNNAPGKTTLKEENTRMFDKNPQLNSDES